MKFATLINCMDGRTQLPAIEYMKKKFNAEFVDSITEPGPVFILSESHPIDLVDSILTRVDISVNKHGSKAIGIIAHHDCAGNPEPYEKQVDQLEQSIAFIKKHYPDIDIVGMWIDENHQLHELNFEEK